MDAAQAVDMRAPPRLDLRVTPLGLAAGLVLLALGLRLVGLNSRPLWLDEAYSAYFAARGWTELWTIVPTYEPHPPFYYSLLKLWAAAFGDGAVALRLSSVALSAATIPLVVAAALELERQRPSGRSLLRAGIAGFLVASAPMLVLLGQEARPYPLMIFAYAAAILALLRLMREFTQGGTGRWVSWLLLALGTELALWSHGLGAFYALCLALALAPAWLGGLTRVRFVRGLVTAAAVAAFYAPCLAMMLGRAGDWGTGWLSWEPLMLLQLIGLYSVPWEALTFVSAVAALTLILLGKRAIEAALGSSGWTADKAVLLLWWGPPLLAALISALAIPVFLPRALAATLVPAYLAIGGALARIASSHERLVLGVALCAPLLVSAVQIAQRPAPEPWEEVVGHLSRHVGPGDRVWLYPNDSALPLRSAGLAMAQVQGIPGDYPATGFKGPIRAGSPAVVSLTAAQAKTLAQNPAWRKVPVIWLVTRQSALFDPRSELPAALGAVRRPGPEQSWGYIAVRPYYRR